MQWKTVTSAPRDETYSYTNTTSLTYFSTTFIRLDGIPAKYNYCPLHIQEVEKQILKKRYDWAMQIFTSVFLPGTSVRWEEFGPVNQTANFFGNSLVGGVLRFNLLQRRDWNFQKNLPWDCHLNCICIPSQALRATHAGRHFWDYLLTYLHLERSVSR